jgi:TrmH family RNA methyltransferase
VLAVAAAPAERSLDALAPATAPLLAIACGVADPGNLGALARTAEAAGASALVLLGGASPWNPKALRGSMGSLLRLPVVRLQGAELVRSALARAGWRQLRAATRGGAMFDETDWSPPLALWLASETGDLPDAALDVEAVTIPMAGPVESLNVTVAAAVLLFAARAGLRIARGAAPDEGRGGAP